MSIPGYAREVAHYSLNLEDDCSWFGGVGWCLVGWFGFFVWFSLLLLNAKNMLDIILIFLSSV